MTGKASFPVGQLSMGTYEVFHEHQLSCPLVSLPLAARKLAYCALVTSVESMQYVPPLGAGTSTNVGPGSWLGHPRKRSTAASRMSGDPPEPVIDPPEPVIDPPEPVIDPPEPVIDPPEPVIDPPEPTSEPPEPPRA